MSDKTKYYEADELRAFFEERLKEEGGELQDWEVRDVLDSAITCEINGETSDGYHTFNELYHHRAVLFSVVCGMFPSRAWKSKLHDNGTMFDGMFIVGIETPEGQATYHYDVEPYWDVFDIKELERAPKWDGHTAAQAIERIGSLRVFGGAFGWGTEG